MSAYKRDIDRYVKHGMSDVSESQEGNRVTSYLLVEQHATYNITFVRP